MSFLFASWPALHACPLVFSYTLNVWSSLICFAVAPCTVPLSSSTIFRLLFCGFASGVFFCFFCFFWNGFGFFFFFLFKPALTLLDFVIFVFNPFCAMKWGLTLLCGSLFELRRRQKQANSGQLAKSRGLASLPHKPWCYLLFGAKAPVFEPNERKWKRASIPSSVQMTSGFFLFFGI